MGETSTVGELLLAWEEARRSGAPVSPAELCRACPEKLDELRRMIAAVESMGAMLATDHGPTVSPAPVPAVAEASGAAGRYIPVRPHAAGGLGEVLLGRDGELDRPVALKRIKERYADDPNARRRFLREAAITARLQHPGIVPVYGQSNDASGRPVYAMRFIEGQSLHAANQAYHAKPVLAEQRRLLQRFVAVCNTIAYAHSRGVIHRDIKPSNIMLGEYGETLVVDWGLAKEVGGRNDEFRGPDSPADVPGHARPPADTPAGAATGGDTRAGVALGTPAFMSPEQAKGENDRLGPAADIFSLGATLYAVLTGRPPYDAGSNSESLALAAVGTFPPPRRVAPAVARPLEAICLKAMAREPQERYASALDLAADIDRWLADEAVSSDHEPWRERAWRWGRRHRTAVAGTLAAGVVALGGLVVGTVLLGAANQRELAERKRAEENEHEAAQIVDSFLTDVSENTLLNVPGLQPLRRELLSRAAAHYDQMSRRGGDRWDDRYRRAFALARQGRICLQIGSMAEAREKFVQAEELATALQREQPADRRPRVELAKVLTARAVIEQAAGRGDLAAVTYEQAVDAWQLLVNEQPNDAGARAALARALSSSARNLSDLGRHEAARQTVRRAIPLNESVLDDIGTNRARADLAACYVAAGQIEAACGRPADAAAFLAKALPIWDQVCRAEPLSLEYATYSANASLTLAVIHLSRNQPHEAHPHLLQALLVRERLARENPTVVAYQVDLLKALGHLGSFFMLTEPPKAREPLERAYAIGQELVRREPTVFEHHHQMMVGGIALGKLDWQMGDRTAAIARWRDVADRSDTLTGQFAASPSLAFFRADARAGLAWALGEAGHHADAAREWQAVARITDTIPAGRQGAEIGAKHAEWALGHCTALMRLGDHAGIYSVAQRLLDRPGVPPDAIYNVACQLALAARAAHRDTTLAPDGRHASAERYAKLAVEALRRAQRLGFFQESANRKQLQADADLTGLHDREDYRQLAAELRRQDAE